MDQHYDGDFFLAALKMLTKDEEKRIKPYDDKTGLDVILATGGKVTIGIGRNLTGRGLSEIEIADLFRNDLDEAYLAGKKLFPRWETYSVNRRLGIVNLIFNIGLAGFLQFKDTIRAIRFEDWKAAGEELVDSLWYDQVGSRAERVINLIEKDLYDY